MRFTSLVLVFLLSVAKLSAQNSPDEPRDYLKLHWRYVAAQMPEEWYGTSDAKRVAENILLAQKDVGGWSKNIPYHHILTDEEKIDFLKKKDAVGATFDNGSTITELRFLASVYRHSKDIRFRMSFMKGLNYIFISQYDNGGWPQFYPVQHDGDFYSRYITYNDDAMVNTMNFLKDIYTVDGPFSALKIDTAQIQKAKNAFDKGVECILKTQIRVNNVLTVWCAQHDEKTFAPAKARSYELPSFSGAESAGIVMLLMNIDDPSKDIIASIEGAVSWFESHKVEGIRVEWVTNDDGKRNKIVVEDKDALPLWGRFNDLDTGLPFFCDRDGIKKNSMAEIGHERRNGYAWYTDRPREVLQAYPAWKERVQN